MHGMCVCADDEEEFDVGMPVVAPSAPSVIRTRQTTTTAAEQKKQQEQKKTK